MGILQIRTLSACLTPRKCHMNSTQKGPISFRDQHNLICKKIIVTIKFKLNCFYALFVLKKRLVEPSL